MKQFNLIIAQNAMGKSTLASGPTKWLGNPIGPKPNTINVTATKYGYMHDLRNWIACGHIDMKAFWLDTFTMIARHDIIMLNNSVDRLPRLPSGINAAFVVYESPRDGLDRWMRRDPTYFEKLSADEGLHMVMKVRDAYLSAVKRQNGDQVRLFELKKGQFLADLADELF